MSKLRRSARNEPCTLNIAGVCNYDPATVVLCHIRDFHGGGTGLKPSDLSAVFGCLHCHTHLDQHKVKGEDRYFYIARAIVRTHERMVEKGLLSIA